MRQPHTRPVRPDAPEPPRESLASTLLALAGVVLFALAVVLVWAGLG